MDPRASVLPNWALEVRSSHLDVDTPPLSSSGYSTAQSSPTTPMPMHPVQQPEGRAHLTPTQPLNIARRGMGDDGRAQLRERDPLPPPSGLPPPPPGQQIPTVNVTSQRSTAGLPATTSAVPPPRRAAIGLGIMGPPPLQTSFSPNPQSHGQGQTQGQSQALTPVDRSLLSPNSAPTPTSASPGGTTANGERRPTRPSSKRALTAALQLAQDAVEYDRSSEAQRAVDAYGKSVALLSEVMERVMRGAEERESRGAGGRRRSVVARDEEVRRLKAIHDTYADRMRILCILHSIAPSPSLPPHVQALHSPTFPPDISPNPHAVDQTPTQQPPPLHTQQPHQTIARPESQDGISAIGNTFVSLEEDDTGSMLDTPSRTTHSTALPAPAPAATPAPVQAATPAPAPALSAQRPGQGWHTRAQSSGTFPLASFLNPTAPAPVAPVQPERPSTARSGSSAPYTLQRSDLPPARPPPVVGLPPLPAEAAGGPPPSRDGPPPSREGREPGSIANRTPPLHGIRQQRSLSSLRQVAERERDLPERDSPTSPTPNTFGAGSSAAGGNASPPKRLTTRSARSSSLSLKSGPPPPPVPPLPPMPGGVGSPQLSSAGGSPNLASGNLVAPSTAHGSIAQRRRGGGATPSPQAGQNGFTPLPNIPALPTIKLPSVPSGPGTPILSRPQTQPAPGTQSSQALRIPGPAGLGIGTPSSGPGSQQQQQGRMRAVSQPGARPSISGIPGTAGVPELPPISLSRTGSSSALSSVATTPLHANLNLPGSSNLSIPSTLGTTPAGSGQPSPVLMGSGGLTITPSTPQAAMILNQPIERERERTVGASTIGGSTVAGGGGQMTVPLSPLPMPNDLALRPFHIMRSLLLSILHPPGFYLTPRLFIPTTLWSQGGAKLEKLPQKTSLLLTLGAALEELQKQSDERERERRGGWAAEGADGEEHWQRALVEWEKVCESIKESTRGKGGFGGIQQAGQGKTGGGGIGWGRLGKQWEKVTSGKNLDSPAAYVQSLTKVFQAAPVIETHLRALVSPNAPSPTGHLPQYAHLSPSQRSALERRLRNSSDFFATTIVPFVVRDLGLLMEKYLKKGEKWLME